MENKVLIVSHTFPPASGVGGRRWAKFSKYLNKNTIIPFILTSKSNFNESLWKEDVKEIKNIFYYKNFFPSILSKTQLTFLDKILYKLAIVFLKIFTKGSYYDKVVFDKKQLIDKIDSLLKKESINDLIVSGAPFNLLYYSAIYKQKNPEINLIVDIRDPWTWGQNYGINLISSSRKQIEKQKESLVINVANTVFVPTGIMYDYLIKTYPNCASKIKVLPHGFDSDSIKPREETPVKQSGKIRIAFIGELYDNIGQYFEKISEAIEKESSPFFIDFFSRTDRYKDLFSQRSLVGTKVNYYPLIKADELFEKLSEYDFILIIHPEFAKDYISTKFYEILYSRTPIIYISMNGETSQFIESTKSGIYLDIDHTFEFFKNDQKVREFKYEVYKDINKFELNYLTQNSLINCLKLDYEHASK